MITREGKKETEIDQKIIYSEDFQTKTSSSCRRKQSSSEYKKQLNEKWKKNKYKLEDTNEKSFTNIHLKRMICGFISNG